MDRKALQSQISGCLAYAGEPFAYAGGIVYATQLEEGIEEVGVEVTYPGTGYRLTYSILNIATPPKAGDILTSGGMRFRILTKPTEHLTTKTAVCIMEELPAS